MRKRLCGHWNKAEGHGWARGFGLHLIVKAPRCKPDFPERHGYVKWIGRGFRFRIEIDKRGVWK